MISPPTRRSFSSLIGPSANHIFCILPGTLPPDRVSSTHARALGENVEERSVALCREQSSRFSLSCPSRRLLHGENTEPAPRQVPTLATISPSRPASTIQSIQFHNKNFHSHTSRTTRGLSLSPVPPCLTCQYVRVISSSLRRLREARVKPVPPSFFPVLTCYI